jgi:hypothetical protein
MKIVVVVDTRNGDQYEVYDLTPKQAVTAVYEQRTHWNWSEEYPEEHEMLIEERFAWRCGAFMAVKGVQQ